MKNKPPINIDRRAAWASLLTNLVVFPGLGSVIAGQRGGWIQVILSAVGLIAMTGWIGWFVWTWIQAGQIPATTGSYFWAAAAGLTLFVAGWAWSVATSIRLIQNVTKR